MYASFRWVFTSMELVYCHVTLTDQSEMECRDVIDFRRYIANGHYELSYWWDKTYAFPSVLYSVNLNLNHVKRSQEITILMIIDSQTLLHRRGQLATIRVRISTDRSQWCSQWYSVNGVIVGTWNSSQETCRWWWMDGRWSLIVVWSLEFLPSAWTIWSAELWSEERWIDLKVHCLATWWLLTVTDFSPLLLSVTRCQILKRESIL